MCYNTENCIIMQGYVQYINRINNLIFTNSLKLIIIFSLNPNILFSQQIQQNIKTHMDFFGILALYIWLSKQNNPYWTYYNKKIGSQAVNSYNSKMLKTNCFIYKSFNFYYSLPTQFLLGFDCVHNTKTTYEFPIQASKLISNNTNSSKYYFYNFRIFSTSANCLRSWHSQKSKGDTNFKIEPANKNSTDM